MICPTKRQNAFTLFEVTLVVFVLALLATLVVVNIHTDAKAASIESRMARIRAMDHSARESSKSLGRSIGIEFDMDALGIKEIRTIDRSATGGGTFFVDCSPMGITPTYALRISAPGADKWVVVAGATGEMTNVKDELEAQSILREASSHVD
jgi:type II secretory pathway pseudopilin PulG